MDFRDVAPEEQQQKTEGPNRQPLQEIGNLVNLHHASNIKNLGVLSLAKDQGAANKNKDKNHKKVTYKSEPETVIVVSSDEDEQEHENHKLSRKKKVQSGHGNNRKKKVHSLTSVLTARSKVACGLGSKPSDQILNIDAADANNELAVVEYVEEIYKFYKIVEDENRVCDYMSWQSHINEKMRMVLVNWLVEVHNKFKLLPETLYLTIDVVDRYLSRKIVPKEELQLLGIASMLLACKYEEIWAPQVNDFMCICENYYSREQILAMEKEIVGRLEWNLTVATPYVFLVRFIKATVPFDKEMENMAFYLAESGLMKYQIVVSFCPSLIAAAAVYAAIHTLGNTVWTETLRHYTGYSEQQIKECANMLIKFQLVAKESKFFKAVHRKFSNTDRGSVALLPPAKPLNDQ